jgi:hypothetical protein
VITDYDSEINFNDFKTYAFFEDVGKGLNELDVKRVISSMNSELKLSGFIELENPDFFINIISKISEAKNNNTIGIGIGSGGRNGGFGISGGIPIGGKKLNEEFIIEFVNAKTDEIIWEGILNSTIKEKRKPEQKEVHFKEIIKKILDKYPPKKKN